MEEKAASTIAYVALGVVGSAGTFGLIGMMADGAWVSPLLAMACGYGLFLCAVLVLVGLGAQTLVGRLLIHLLLDPPNAAPSARDPEAGG